MNKTLIIMLMSLGCYAQSIILPNGNDTFITGGGIVVDNKNQNTGTFEKGIRFGSFSGEGIGSNRILNTNLYGLDFYTNTINRMSITNDGNIGIDTKDPQTKLQVNNGAISLFNTVANKRWVIDYDRPNGYFFLDEFGAGRRFIIKNGGNVGIGTDNPRNLLHLHKSTADLNFLQITNSATGTATAIDGLRIGIDNVGNSFFWNGENKNIHFVANGEFNMTIAQTSGNVGIGTEAPPAKLSVNNGGISLLSSANPTRWEMNVDPTNNYFYIDEFGIGRRMVVKHGGFVGIGTTSPEYPLEIVGENLKTVNGRFYENYPIVYDFVGIPLNYSLKVSHAVAGVGFMAFSDARHKRIIERTNPTAALHKILELKPTNYKFIDSVSKGNQIQFGFIAQEVEAVLPEAVNQIKQEFIPNLYCFSEKIEQNLTEKKLTIRTPKPHEFGINDEVKLILPEEEKIVKVFEVIDNQTFVIQDWGEKIEKIFIFGKKVSDFRTVDYDKIFTLGITAIQELSREVENLKKSHEKRIADLESKIDTVLNLKGK